MKSLASRMFIHGILLQSLIAAAVFSSEIVENAEVVTIEQITEPVDHAEGPHWSTRSQKLYFVDTYAQKIYCFNPGTGELTSAYIENGQTGAVVTVAGSSNQFIAGAGTEIVLITWDSENNSTDPEIEVLATVDQDRNGTRFNDGKVDPEGRLWMGTTKLATVNGNFESDPDQGSVYRFGSDYITERVISPVSVSNGLAWNKKEEILYYIDSLTQQVVAYDFEPCNGNISNKRVVFDLPSNNVSGFPDGMTIDTNDNLWIATFNGSQVINVDPIQGTLIRSIDIPVLQVTSVMFGGPMFDILYVTTSRHTLTAEEIATQPKTGSVFAVKGLGVQGLPTNSFALHKMNS